MAEDVCESWEELIKDENPKNESTIKLDTKLNNKSNCSTNSPNDTLKSKLSNKLNDDKLSNLYLNNVVDKPDVQNKKQQDFSYSTALNKNLTANCANKSLQISFEDNSRTQFMSQIHQQNSNKIKILKRPKQEMRNEIATNAIRNGQFNAKTIKEREEEYAKARLRILGLNYENEDQSNEQKINESNEKKDDNLIRNAQGPASNSVEGFSQRR